ncbi:FHA domain-containing protein [bacterium]|nr:FHA domain-containing protein [bacterium]
MLNSGLQMKVTEGAARGSIHPLDSPRISIGRAESGCVRQVGWVHLRDETVSGLQAELVWQSESRTFTLINRSNTNPTKVNEVEISQVELKPGDQIRMGRCLVDLQETDRRFVSRKIQAAKASEAPQAVLAQPAPTMPQRPTITRYYLEFLEGTNAGQRIPLESERIAVGGAYDPGHPPEENWFDQGIALGDSSLPPYCLALVRRGQEFALLAPRDSDVPAGLEREEDDLIWVAQLQAGQAVDLEADDQVRLGYHRMRVLRREVSA